MQQSQALVTGATGFIGRHVVRELLQEGQAIRVLARSPAKAQALFGDQVEVAAGDLRNAHAVAQAVQGIQRVYHAAGVYRFGSRHRHELAQVNVEGTRLLLEAAWKARVESFVQVSSAGVLAGGALPLTEAAFPAQPSIGCFYKNSKWRSERLALQWAGKGLPVAIASPTCPLGAQDEGPTPTGRIVLDFLRGRFPFAAETGLNFLSVQDLARGIIAVGKRGRRGERYILGDANLSLREFLHALGREAGRAAPRLSLPWPVILLAGIAGEVGGMLVPSWDTNLCLETAIQSARLQFFSSQKAREELQWKPQVTFQEALRESVQWFQSRLNSGVAVKSLPLVEAVD